jgi:hypothetical protein
MSILCSQMNGGKLFMKLHKILTGVILFTGVLGLSLFTEGSNSTAQAKSAPRIAVMSSKGHNIKFAYSSKQTRTIGTSSQLGAYIEDVNVKVKSLNYYKLKHNKYGKTVVVRLNLLAKSTGKEHEDYRMFTPSDWRGKPGYISTNNGYRLTQAVNTHRAPWDFPVTLAGKDARAFHVDFTSKRNVALNESSHGNVHFYFSVGGNPFSGHFSY